MPGTIIKLPRRRIQWKTRRSKRLRQTLTSASLEQPGAVNLLNTLTDDVLCHIVRWVSPRPLLSQWISCIEPRDALCLLKCGGQLRRAAQSMIKFLRLASWSPDDRTLSDDGVTVDLDLELQLFEPLLIMLAPTLRVLVIC
eukprot:IDg5514t1